MKTVLKNIVVIFSMFLLSSCYMTSNLIEYGEEFSVIDSDTLLAIGKTSNDNRFTVIGDKYVYVFDDKSSKQITDILSSNPSNYVIEDANSKTINEIKIRKYDKANKKPNACFYVYPVGSNKSENHFFCWVDIDLYIKPQDIEINNVYIFKQKIKINITAKNNAKNVMSNVLLPFALLTDIVLFPIMPSPSFNGMK
ncbi:MAG: hypothetical protein IJ187_06140 [Neisseriaceae bacterium]|nr:hypothetical protein [Neisseriaceae bacterium]